MKNKNITILGAGISGLATAHWLEKEGYSVTILEKLSEPGGSMQSKVIDDFLIDFGPNSGLETTPKIKEIVDDIGLSQEMIYANREGNNRYILKNNKLISLPTSPINFFKTSLFSIKAKLRLFLEPFIGKSEDGYNQSISEFVTRRLGHEFLDYAIDPFVSGVFAGDPKKLSVKSAFPKLYRLEELYGGLIKGMIRGARERKKSNEESKQHAKMFSFLNGMQSFPKAIAKKIKGSIVYNCSIDSFNKDGNCFNVKYSVNGIEHTINSDVLLSTIPAYKLSELTNNIDSKLTEHLNAIYYPPVLILFLGYETKVIKQKMDGFGFLIPTKENKKFLGSIWSSTIFKNRSKKDMASFTVFIGGAKNPSFKKEEIENKIPEVLKEFHDIMGITESPIFIEKKFWKKAIPQYNLGYIEHENYFKKFEESNSGIFLSGNYVGGISVGDCIKNSYNNFEKIKKYLES